MPQAAVREQVEERQEPRSPALPPIPISEFATDSPMVKPDDTLIRKIRALAYGLYEQRGRINGHELEDWLMAEAIVRETGKLAA